MNKLVLLRHGESVWNLENRFTGWTDVDLSTHGLEEAALAGQLLKEPAHGNTLRALIKYLDRVSDERIPALEVPTGIPLVYELDNDLTPRARYYLGDSVAAREAQKELVS
jgi:bisphosphoglycerate-dependent phosphoglycerate mutase